MRLVILRTIPAILLLLAGAAALVYGVRDHTITVTEQREVEVKTAPPEFLPPHAMTLPPFMPPIKQKVLVVEDASEPTVINEITFGGVTLLADGRIQRTYTGKPPSLCPT